jgi:nucleotide-binding universal stress UspA family protein
MPDDRDPLAPKDDLVAAPRRIVVGYLRSREGEAALSRAIAIARRNNSHITVVHASLPPDETAEIDYYDQELEGIDRILANEGIDHDIVTVSEGIGGAEAILDAIEDAGADLAVIGVRSRSRVGKVLLGSDTQSVILGASCPVLSVRPMRRNRSEERRS